MNAAPPVRRALFVVTILTGSFLLFLVQPMVARMALPRLGGAPNVWNSAMLVYQALLLAGYGYAHWLGKLALHRQAQVHLALLLLAGLSLPITLADLPPPEAGMEALWVPLLFLLTIGPVFFLVSAQAPLMQRWYAAHPQAGEPWALYAASNLGSFAGLLAYPLLAEPLLNLHEQSLTWSIGYGLLIVLIGLSAWARWQVAPPGGEAHATVEAAEPVGTRRILQWLALSAVPSGLMLSTTTHLTTDIFAMPLLWVIPLGLYLLSFVFAFSDRRTVVRAVTVAAPLVMLLAGGQAMSSHGSATLTQAFATVFLLFVVAVTLHGRMYDLRPAPSQLTLFYFVMSAGGALGGLFTALFAPLVFDWVWEHPILIVAAALLLPMPSQLDWRRIPGLDPGLARFAGWILLVIAAVLAWRLRGMSTWSNAGMMGQAAFAGLLIVGMLLVPWRRLYVALLVILLLTSGGLTTLRASLDGARTRSYFGIYTVRDYSELGLRTLAHGTTLHGQQALDPAHARDPMTYYGPGSGVAIALEQARAIYGDRARIGIVGLGTGTLACYRREGEVWTFFEIDPAVLDLSRQGKFTYLERCAPQAKIVIGDARIELARIPQGSFDVLAIDAFSSDAIPLHLLTREAFDVYLDALSPRGVVLIHISNRYIDLEPVIAALAKERGLTARLRHNNPHDRLLQNPSIWVALGRDSRAIDTLAKADASMTWRPLAAPAPRVWSDDHASVLSQVRWSNLIRKSGT